MNHVFNLQTNASRKVVRRAVNSVACVMLLAGGARLANAAGGICLLDSAGFGYATYGSSNSCDAGIAAGFNLFNFDGFESATSTSTNPGLTTGFLTAMSSASGGTASSFASLEQGKLRAFAFSGSAGLPRSIAEAIFFDVLHFTITDGAPSAPITVKIHVQGTQDNADNWGIGFSADFLGEAFNYFTRSNPPGFGFTQFQFAPDFSVNNVSANGFDVTGVVNVTNGETAGVHLGLTLDCSKGSNGFTTTCDYSTDNTATLSWVLPSNVQVTSDSGVFLSQIQSSFTIQSAKLNAVPGSAGSFDLNATFALSSPTATIDPTTQPVTLQVGPYQVTIPPNSFHVLLHGAKAGSYVYSGTVNGVSLDFQITPLGGGKYQFKSTGSPVNFSTLTQPATVTIAVGNNSGTTQVSF